MGSSHNNFSPSPSPLPSTSQPQQTERTINKSLQLLDRREEERWLIHDLQTNTVFQQSVPLLIESISQTLMGWTHALLLLDSNPNTFTYTSISGSNGIQNRNIIRTVGTNEVTSIPLTAIQTAVRSFCPSSSSSTQALGNDNDPSDDLTALGPTLNHYATKMMKLLLMFGSYPYPHSPAIPTALIKTSSSSRAVRQGVSSLTLSQLIFTRTLLPSLPFLEFVSCLDYMHLNTPTGVAIYGSDPKDINLQVDDFQRNHLLYSHGFTPLHISSRHSNLHDTNHSIIRFLLLNRCYRSIVDDEKELAPLMLLVQNVGNIKALIFFLKFDGVFSLFTRRPHKVGYKNHPDANTLGLVRVDFKPHSNDGTQGELFHRAENKNKPTIRTPTAPLITSQAQIILRTKSQILINEGYPNNDEAWFTDGYYDYFPILSKLFSKSIIEFSLGQYLPTFKTAIFKWKTQSLKRYQNAILDGHA
jgi:hypothetical protein